MGNPANRRYIRNFAKTLMGQLGVDEDEVGISNYKFDLIAANIREDLVRRVYVDLRNLNTATLARLAECGIMGTPKDQQNEPGYSRLHRGLEPCTMCFVHPWEHPEWILEKRSDGPVAIIRFMAATAIVAAMYDLIIEQRVKQGWI